MKPRRTIGWALVVASVLAAAILQISTGKLAQVRSLSSQTLPDGHGQVVMIGLHCHWQYAIPLGCGFLLGLACAIWPSRKPPRLACT